MNAKVYIKARRQSYLALINAMRQQPAQGDQCPLRTAFMDHTLGCVMGADGSFSITSWASSSDDFDAAIGSYLELKIDGEEGLGAPVIAITEAIRREMNGSGHPIDVFRDIMTGARALTAEISYVDRASEDYTINVY